MSRWKHYVSLDTATAVSDNKFEKDFPIIPHSSYEWERGMLSYVQAGDVKGYLEYIDYMRRIGQITSVENAMAQAAENGKYLAVSAIAVITRVAINSGADELTAYQLSDQFLQRLEQYTQKGKLFEELTNSCVQIIQAVHTAQIISKNNFYFTRCREYICSHLGQKITVRTLADVCGLTPNYLSTIFKKVSGKTIKEYVLEERIRVAKQLLLSPDYTMNEIAVFLGFASQSHFIDCFKKFTGTTPRRWRMRQDLGTGVELYPGL